MPALRLFAMGAKKLGGHTNFSSGHGKTYSKHGGSRGNGATTMAAGEGKTLNKH